MVHFPDAPHGLPTSWVPPGVSPSPNPPSNLRRTAINRPHPFGKGGRLWYDLASEVSGGVINGPTSLMRGEGHLGGLFRVVEGEDGVARVMVVVKE